MKKILKFQIAAVSLVAFSPLSMRAASVTLDFSTAGQYSDNFVEILNAGNIGHNAANQNVLYNPAGANGTSIIRYDTLPGNAAYDDANFLTETVSADITFPDLASNQSFGFYTRIQTSGEAAGLGILGLLNKVSNGNSLQLRLFSGADSLGVGVGTPFYNATFNLTTGVVTPSVGTGGIGSTNPFAANSPLTFSMTQTSGEDPVFSFSVSDAEGLIASTGDQVLTTTELYNGAGAIGVRFNSGSTGASNTITMDNFSAVPEPSTAALVALAAMGLVRRRR